MALMTTEWRGRNDTRQINVSTTRQTDKLTDRKHDRQTKIEKTGGYLFCWFHILDFARVTYSKFYFHVQYEQNRGCVLPYGRHFRTGYGMFSLWFNELWLIHVWFSESQWLCGIPYENACRTRVRNLPIV